MKTFVKEIAATALLIAISVPAIAADDEHHHLNHIAFLVGAAQEVHEDGNREKGGVIGIAYDRRLSDSWSLAFSLEQEAFGERTQRHGLFFAGASYNITHPWTVFGGPGVESRERGEPDHALFRMGTGYHFKLGRRFSLSPELYIDLVSGGSRVYVFALALGYDF